MKISSISIVVIVLVLLLESCSQADGNRRGHEFMPDMYHGTAYEANYYDYYWFNTWGGEEAYYEFAQPRHPVEGTIARGYVGMSNVQSAEGEAMLMSHLSGAANTNAIRVTSNGAVPYYYADTEDERTRAMNEITANPYPITTRSLENGKALYTIYCGVCHGDKADGNGYLVRDDGGFYPAQPTSFVTDELIDASNGRYYHSIMYGKNMMGEYSDKLSYEERWQVIQYIRSLQAASRGVQYDADQNELNNTDQPGASLEVVYHDVDEVEHDEEEGHDSDGDTPHSDDHH